MNILLLIYDSSHEQNKESFYQKAAFMNICGRQKQDAISNSKLFLFRFLDNFKEELDVGIRKYQLAKVMLVVCRPKPRKFYVPINLGADRRDQLEARNYRGILIYRADALDDESSLPSQPGNCTS